MFTSLEILKIYLNNDLCFVLISPAGYYNSQEDNYVSFVYYLVLFMYFLLFHVDVYIK